MHYLQLGIRNIPSSSADLPPLTITHFCMFLLQHNKLTQYVQFISYLHFLQKIKYWSTGRRSILKTWKFVITATWILLLLWCFLCFLWVTTIIAFWLCVCCIVFQIMYVIFYNVLSALSVQEYSQAGTPVFTLDPEIS
jgi:hypothetical protein